jgi:hypothetical protein
MGQASLFDRAEIAGMRDRTASRNYSPAREEFRREHERRRAWGLKRRHAEKLRRLGQGESSSRTTPDRLPAANDPVPTTTSRRRAVPGPQSPSCTPKSAHTPSRPAAPPSRPAPSNAATPPSRPSPSPPAAPHPATPPSRPAPPRRAPSHAATTHPTPRSRPDRPGKTTRRFEPDQARHSTPRTTSEQARHAIPEPRLHDARQALPRLKPDRVRRATPHPEPQRARHIAFEPHQARHPLPRLMPDPALPATTRRERHATPWATPNQARQSPIRSAVGRIGTLRVVGGVSARPVLHWHLQQTQLDRWPTSSIPASDLITWRVASLRPYLEAWSPDSSLPHSAHAGHLLNMGGCWKAVVEAALDNPGHVTVRNSCRAAADETHSKICFLCRILLIAPGEPEIRSTENGITQVVR